MIICIWHIEGTETRDGRDPVMDPNVFCVYLPFWRVLGRFMWDNHLIIKPDEMLLHSDGG